MRRHLQLWHHCCGAGHGKMDLPQQQVRTPRPNSLVMLHSDLLLLSIQVSHSTITTTTATTSISSKHTVGSSLLSLQFLSHSPLVRMASILTLVLGPIVAIQARTLHRGGIRIITNELRQEINYCQIEQERLHRSLLRLDHTMEQLQAMEQEISRYSRDPVILRKLVRLVQEQSLIQQKMNKTLQQQVIQTIMKGVVQSNRDNNDHLGPCEVDALILQLQQLPGISMNEIIFREKMTTGDQSLQTVMNLMRHLDDNDILQMTPKKWILPQKLL